MKATEGNFLKASSLLLILLLQHSEPSRFASIDRKNVKHLKCENLEVPLCQRFHKQTTFPNQLNEKNQWEAAINLHQMLPLARTGCSPDIKRFLCITYMPPCGSSHPSSSVKLCKKVRSDCSKRDILWPIQLRCESLQGAKKIPTTNLKKIGVRPSKSETSARHINSPPKCVPVQVKACRHFYNHTRMPNFLDHRTLRLAKFSFQILRGYIKRHLASCRQPLTLFLCSLFLPKCTEESNVPALPCRRLCRRVKQHCKNFFLPLGFTNNDFDCNVFPREKNQSCLKDV